MGDNSPDTPSITSLSASSGAVGATIQINGRNFGSLRRNAKVTFNGTVATGATFTDTKVTAKVPPGATPGPVKVYDWEGTASNGVTFTVSGEAPPPTPTVPSVTSISPGRGPLGTVVTITGSGFGASRGTSTVKFRSTAVASAGYDSWSDTRIVGRVPSGAWGKTTVSVTTGGGTSNAVYFQVTPKITSFTPTSIQAGRYLTIKGQAFGQRVGTAPCVYFGSTRVSAYGAWTDTSIVVKTPGGRGSVSVTVKTAGGSSSKYITVY